MKKLISLFLILLLASTALADTYKLHTPDRNQVKEDQALAFANAFWQELCGVSIAPAVQSGRYDASFGPGYQWGVEAQDDCWVISVNDVDGPIRSLFLILHGTPLKSEDGTANINVLYWSFRGTESMITYSCAIPDVTMIDRYKAVQRAVRDFAAVSAISEESITFNGNGQFTLTKWAMRDICEDLGELDGDVPVWSLALMSETQYASYLISAYDGTVVYRSLTERED